MNPNTSNNGQELEEEMNKIDRAYQIKYPDFVPNETVYMYTKQDVRNILKTLRKQGYTKCLDKILKRLRYRQTKIRNLWMATKLKEYEYAKMVLEEEIRIIEQELEEEKKWEKKT